MKKSFKHKVIFPALSILFGLSLILLIAEVVLRFLPVSDPLISAPVNKQNPLARYEPNRNITFSKGWKFSILVRHRINNYGFVNEKDYDSNLRTPLLAIIGDSYIEAEHVPYESTVHGRLQHAVGDAGRVYSFGKAGAPLSQYLYYIGYVNREFRPDGIVVSIVDNDFYQSLLRRKSLPGFHYYDRLENGSLNLTLKEYKPSLIKRIFRNSRLVMYLTVDLDFITGFRKLFYGWTPNDEGYEQQQPVCKEMVEQFFADLAKVENLERSRLVFSVDGVRRVIYGEPMENIDRFFYAMRDYFIRRALEEGYGVIDMNGEFASEYAVKPEKFDFAIDYHWNAHGHKVMASAIMNSRLFSDVFGLSATPDGGSR